MKMLNVMYILMLGSLIFFTTGCATFPGNQLPKQSVKPQMMKQPFLISEVVSFDSTTSICGSAPAEFLTPNLEKVVSDAGGIFQFHARVREEIGLLKKSKEVTMRVDKAMKIEEIGLPLITKQVYSAGYVTTFYMPDPVAKRNLYEKLFEREAHKEFSNKMRTDSAFRQNILTPDAVWFDCRTSVEQGNPATWRLEALLCGISLSLFPAHHNKVLSVKVLAYENGKIYKREYTDYWNAWFWLPLFPVGLMQGSWPDDKIIKTVMDNMALTIVNDFQKNRFSTINAK